MAKERPDSDHAGFARQLREMMRTRRQVLQDLAMLGGLALPRLSAGAASLHVAVVGGGFAGMSCIRALRELLPDCRISLVEPRARFITGPLSNGLLAGFIAAERLQANIEPLVRQLSLRWLPLRAERLDAPDRCLYLADGSRLRADCFVIAPGIDLRYEAIEGLDAQNSSRMPHGWLLDAQLPLLQRRLAALPERATLLISAPPLPYRCPLAPYERAAAFAWYAQRRRKRWRILIADAKDDFPLSAAFMAGWEALYPQAIEWLPRAAGGRVRAVDARAGSVLLDSGERVRADLISLIPPQTAGALAQRSDLCDESLWCPVAADSFASLRHEHVYVVGDASQALPLPKSASAAHAQGRACAQAIASRYAGQASSGAGILHNACYSLLAPDYALSVESRFASVGGRLNRIEESASPAQADRGARAMSARAALAAQAQLLRDSFQARD